MTILLRLENPEEIDRYASDFFIITEFLKHKRKMIDATADICNWDPSTRIRQDVWEKAMKDNARFHKESAEHIWNNVLPDWAKDILMREI